MTTAQDSTASLSGAKPEQPIGFVRRYAGKYVFINSSEGRDPALDWEPVFLHPASAPRVDASVGTDRAPGGASVPPNIAAIIESLHTQDNRCTANPLFAVQQRRRIYGLDDGYEDGWVWSVDGDEVTDAEEIKHLDRQFSTGDLSDGARRIGYKDTWEFVTGCFTEQGCEDYIARNGHNLEEPRIYAYGSYRNAEFIALREWLMSLRVVAIREHESE